MVLFLWIGIFDLFFYQNFFSDDLRIQCIIAKVKMVIGVNAVSMCSVYDFLA